MRKKSIKGIVAVLLGVSMLGGTVLAGNGSFNFTIKSSTKEVGTGAWINKGISANYANVTVNNLMGEGAYLYVKNPSGTTVSEKKQVIKSGHYSVKYKSGMYPMQMNYQLFAKGFLSGSDRSTTLNGVWTP